MNEYRGTVKSASSIIIEAVCKDQMVKLPLNTRTSNLQSYTIHTIYKTWSFEHVYFTFIKLLLATSSGYSLILKLNKHLKNKSSPYLTPVKFRIVSAVWL